MTYIHLWTENEENINYYGSKTAKFAWAVVSVKVAMAGGIYIKGTNEQ